MTSANAAATSAEDFAKEDRKKAEAEKNRSDLSKDLKKLNQAALKSTEDYRAQLEDITGRLAAQGEYYPDGDWKLKWDKLCGCSYPEIACKEWRAIRGLRERVASCRRELPGLKKAYDDLEARVDLAKKAFETLTGYGARLQADLKDLDTLQKDIDSKDDADELGQMWFLLWEYRNIVTRCGSPHPCESAGEPDGGAQRDPSQTPAGAAPGTDQASGSEGDMPEVRVGLGCVLALDEYTRKIDEAWNALRELTDDLQEAWKAMNDTKIDLEDALAKLEAKEKGYRETVLLLLKGKRCKKDASSDSDGQAEPATTGIGAAG